MKLADGDFSNEARQALINLGTVLKAADSSYEKVVKATVFLNDLNNFNDFNTVYKECKFVKLKVNSLWVINGKLV